MVTDKRPQSALDINELKCNQEADCIYAVITGKRPVSRRNRASWYLSQLNKVIRCDTIESIVESDEETGEDADKDKNNEFKDIRLMSVTCSQDNSRQATNGATQDLSLNHSKFLITPNSRVNFLSRSVATSIILDLSPSVVSVNSENSCVFLDSMFDALKRTLHLLVKSHEIPSTLPNAPCFLEPKVSISVIAYTPFIIAKNNQVIVQNRRISSLNISQVLVELWVSLKRLTNEIHELVSSTCGVSLDFELNKVNSNNVFMHPHLTSSTIMRHPGSVLEDIFELGLFASSLMPRLSRLSIMIISDGLFSSANDLNIFRIKSIAVSFISLGPTVAHPDSCFGYTPYTDLMRFIAKTTLGVYLSHQDLIYLSQSLSKTLTVGLLQNPLYKLFCWSLHSEDYDQICSTPLATNYPQLDLDSEFVTTDTCNVSRFFNLDQPSLNQQQSTNGSGDEVMRNNQNFLDWRLFKQLDRNLDADFEQVLACLLREGYLIKYIQFKRNEQTRIVARLVLHWRYNLDLEQELTASYWSSTDPFELGDANQLMMRPFNTPLYGDTVCEIFVHGSYSFLHNLYCNRKTKRRSEYRDLAYKQFRQLIDCVCHTHDRLQYLSRFYRDSSLSKVPPYLLHGNSLFYEQPHTHRLTSTIENVINETKINEFQEYWQKISCLETRSWKNLMHVHTLRLILEHDQPKHKNIQHQNANGRYTHVQCRRSLSAISNFIKSYASFALLEDSTYIKFIYNRDDDLREIETSATKGFIVIRINKLLPIVVVHLMFTSGILDSNRVQIVSYLEDQLTSCKFRTTKVSVVAMDNILRCKTISPSSESCCVSIKSPLERMLKVYSRNFIFDFLVDNWTHGLPGSCQYSNQQSIKLNRSMPGHSAPTENNNLPNALRSSKVGGEQQQLRGQEQCGSEGSLSNRYNIIFGKYLYGIRVINTIANLPHDILPLLTANVLSKISAILVNTRIKQGFHIAFNSSGILNLVVELSMKDPSNLDHTSNSLCQYIVFPPTIINTNQHDIGTVLGNAGSGSINATNGGVSSKPSSLTGSLANSDNYMKASSIQEANSLARTDGGEIKMIREYWIEQQYGISAGSDSYHKSLENMRYSQVIDHLYLTDSLIFECLLTYDILLLLCDKLSPFYDLDISLSKTAVSSTPTNNINSPLLVSATTSCDIMDNASSLDRSMPSRLIEPSSNKDTSPLAPLLESKYKFSLVKFLDYCQLANLSVLLFRETSEFLTCNTAAEEYPKKPPTCDQTSQRNDTMMQANQIKSQLSRKISTDISDYDTSEYPTSGIKKREHRSSYQNEHFTHINNIQQNSIYGASLNHLFLDTLHRKFKQMHDKELKLSKYDLHRLPSYMKRRSEDRDESSSPGGCMFYASKSSLINVGYSQREDDFDTSSCCASDESSQTDESYQESGLPLIEWRCYLRRANQENLMIILIPDSLSDVAKWLDLVSTDSLKPPNTVSVTKRSASSGLGSDSRDPVCPVFVFRCSNSMMNRHVLSFMNKTSELYVDKSEPEADMNLHFGQQCRYMNRMLTINEELDNDTLSITRFGANPSQTTDEKTLEVVHFRAFLRKVKNTVLKSRFSSLNDAYLCELFVHKDDILYYINNVDPDTQKKYHVSSHLRNLAEFIKNYQDYNDAIPREQGKPCNKLLNSILLQKCGLFINQPIARYDESNPLMRHLHDKKLLFLMRCNYKVELPLLEETLAKSSILRSFLSTKQTSTSGSSQQLNAPALASSSWAITNSNSTLQESPVEMSHISSLMQSTLISSSLGKPNDGSKMMEIKCGSVGGNVISPRCSALVHQPDRTAPVLKLSQTATRSSINSILSTSLNESSILEAFRSTKNCALKDIPSLDILSPAQLESDTDVSLRHEAHLAEVLKRSRERKESHHYRRVLKSKGTYNQSHSAIDQALRKVDSLGRLEHFCLTPLLFSTSLRSKLAPVRDHTLEIGRSRLADVATRLYGDLSKDQNDGETKRNVSESSSSTNTELGAKVVEGDGNGDGDAAIECHLGDVERQQQHHQEQEDADERWNQMVCNNYIKEYEQYIQTLGFNSVQIRQQSALKTSASPSTASVAPTGASSSSAAGKPSSKRVHRDPPSTANLGQLKAAANNEVLGPSPKPTRKGSVPTTSLSPSSLSSNTTTTTYNTGYLIKFLNGGCLVFKVGFCKPYVYSILYSIEGERFNNSNTKMNMATFLDELDNIKVTLHLHSFTYDYHLRGIYSYISGRQLTFGPGYHLISFLDDFRKYYQKAPNYARNHILSGDICVSDIKVRGQQLYNYIVTHNSAYNMDVLEMSSSFAQMISALASSQRPFATMYDNGDNRSEHSVSPKEISIPLISDQDEPPRSHANDYVLIELKREKIRYRDGKDPDIFDCALLIAHDFQSSNSKSNALTLKYFLLLTNQRDFYPKLIHTYDSIIGLGCHRPIRLGIAAQAKSNQCQQQNQSIICDEEITYLGYFSSEEMDMLKFLQEKTDNLREHIEQVVRQAEIHYQRDFLWQKLMQRSSPNSKSDESPLSVEELVQLLAIVEAIDLTALDSQLSMFSSMHINWHLKLVRLFADLKASSTNQHRIYIVKASKLLVIYMDPKCTSAFILLTVDTEKATVEQNLLMKDKQDCTRMASPKSSATRLAGRLSPQQQQQSSGFELDQDCQLLINDFVNFCATFMWSTFLT